MAGGARDFPAASGTAAKRGSVQKRAFRGPPSLFVRWRCHWASLTSRFARSARFGRDSNSSFGRSFGEYAAPYFRDSRIQVARRQNRFGLVPRWIKFLIAGVALALAAVPATFIVTLLLYPFWSWVEATYRIESIGHSGPADWCFIVVYGVFLVLLLLLGERTD